MHKSPRLAARFPIGTKYVVEARGPSVRRYVEFPDGSKMPLSPRKAATCGCLDLRNVSVVPADDAGAVDRPLVDVA